jgi:MFS family permease
MEINNGTALPEKAANGSAGTIPIALRWTTNAFTLLSSLLFSGVIFGWAPLELILLREGQYSELCSASEDLPCPSQMNRLNIIFTLAQFFLSFASLPIGFFMDHAPKTLHFSIAGLLEISGLVLFGLSDSKTNDWFPVAYSLMALGGSMTMLGSFPASFLLPRHQAGILAAGSCLFDASSIVFFIFHRLDLSGLAMFTRQNLFFSLACIAAANYGALALCWMKLERRNWKKVLDNERLQDWEQESDDEEFQPASNPHGDRVERLGMHHRSVPQQLCTFDFLLALTFASVHMVRCNFFIMTVDSFLFFLGDTDAVYANIFSLVMPGGVFMVPFIEATVTRMGILNTLHFTNFLGVIFGVLLLVPSLPIQIITFVVFTCFRAYLYASLNNFIAQTFGLHTMGRIFGFVFTSAAILSLLQYPAAVLANGHFTVVFAISLGIGFIPIFLAIVYAKKTLAPTTGKLESVDGYGAVNHDDSDEDYREFPTTLGTPMLFTLPGSSLTKSLRMSRRGTESLRGSLKKRASIQASLKERASIQLHT